MVDINYLFSRFQLQIYVLDGICTRVEVSILLGCVSRNGKRLGGRRARPWCLEASGRCRLGTPWLWRPWWTSGVGLGTVVSTNGGFSR